MCEVVTGGFFSTFMNFIVHGDRLGEVACRQSVDELRIPTSGHSTV